MDKGKITYRNSYGYIGEQLRSFNVFGFVLAEEIIVQKLNEKLMLFINSKKKAQMTISLINNQDNITVDQFINEFDRLRSLPNTGKGLYDKKQIN